MRREFFTAQMTARVYVSSAADDQELRKSLLQKMKEPLEGVRIRAMSQDDVRPGDVRSERQAELLEEAEFIILLITSAYLAVPELDNESSRAMEKSKARTAVVIPVLLTDQDYSNSAFGSVEPLRLQSLYLQNPRLWSSEIAKEVHRAIVRRVQARPLGYAESSHYMGIGYGYELHFLSNWRIAAGLLALAALVTLTWFSADPAAHKITYQSHASFTFFFNSIVIGISSMSLIQICRRLFRVRGAFHRGSIEEWLGRDASEELYREIGPQRIYDMFDLPSELLTGQLGAIADRVLEKEGKNKPTSALIRRMAADHGAVWGGAPEEQNFKISYAMAIQRNLDQFQISTSADWGRCLLKTSILLSMALFILGLRLLNYGSFIPGLINLTPGAIRLSVSAHIANLVFLLTGTVLTSLVAASIGSIARDVVAILEKLRR